MENNKRRGAGGITFLMLIVILFGALWFTNQIEQKERELSYSDSVLWWKRAMQWM